MKKVIINHDVCIKCGLCTSLAPEVFAMGATEIEVTPPAPDKLAEQEPLIEQAVQSCPVMAITYEEEITNDLPAA